MITKELLSEVLGCIVEDFKTTHIPSSDIGYYALGSSFSVNTYELAHKCKEWANKQDYGYTINSCIRHTKGCAQVEWYEKNHSDKHGTYRELTFYSEWFKADNNNEPEAIVEACHWILDNRSIK